MIVMKFGGTSVKDADAMKRAIGIVKSELKRKPIVVLSACSGITDKLLDLVKNAPVNSKAKNNKIIDEIETHHFRVAAQLVKKQSTARNAIESIQQLIAELRRLIEGVKLLKEFTPRSTAQAVSYGELLSSTIFHYSCQSHGIASSFADARDLMKTDSNFLLGAVDFNTVKVNSSNFKKALKLSDAVITQGFIGSDKNGRTTTLGRGGSDYSAAIFGASVKAEEIQIWTDVSGILTTDPRIVKSAKTIPSISVNEVRELSFYGAKVLHPDTIKPATEKKVPVRILNTFHPSNKGTLIVDGLNSKKQELHSVILKNNCLELTFNIPANKNPQKYLSEIIGIALRKELKIMYSVCTENNCRLVIENFKPQHYDFNKIFNGIYPKSYRTAMICICGTNLNSEPISTKVRKLINTLSESNVNQIVFGASEDSVLALVNQENSINLLKKIHSIIVK